MAGHIVVEGVKYVLDADGRTLRTKGEVERFIRVATQVRSQFVVPQDAEIARLNALLAEFPSE